MSTSRRLNSVPDSPRRGSGLIRVSKVGDRGEDLTSPEIQEQKIAEYAAAHGIVVVEWVRALDESASASRSPWWARLDAAIGRIEAGEIDTILVWRLSRAARHRRRWAVAIDRVDVAGGTLESATEPIDATTSTGRLARGMLAELSAWEADVKGEVWKETVDRRRRAGLGHTNFPRLGYLRADDRDIYLVDDETAPLLTSLYRAYLAGDGGRQLADRLNTLGVRQPRFGGRWESKTVFRMLDSGWAAGLLRVGDSYIEGAHPAVIDDALWRRYLRERQRRRGVAPRLVTARTALSGLVRCGSCGRAMRVKRTRRWNRNTGRTEKKNAPIYACETHGCERHSYVSVRRAVLEVQKWLTEQANDIDVSAAANAAETALRQTARSDRHRLEREVARIDSALGRLTVDLASGLVLPEHYRAARDALTRDREIVLAGLAACEEVSDRPRMSRRRIVRLLDAWGEMDELGRNRALKDLLWKLEVTRSETRPVLRPFGVWDRPASE